MPDNDAELLEDCEGGGLGRFVLPRESTRRVHNRPIQFNSVQVTLVL